jgi:hypothetical protein
MSENARREILLCLCGAIGAMTGRTVDTGLLRGMVWTQARHACEARGLTPGGQWRYERDVSAAIRRLEKRGVLHRIDRLGWSVVLDIERQIDQVAKDIS